MKRIRKRFSIPIYKIGFTVIFTKDLVGEVNTFIKDYPVEKTTTAIAFNNYGKGEFAVVFSEKSGVGNIVHECKHTVNGIFSYIGMKLDQENDEVECYLLEYLVGKVMEVYNLTK